MSFRLLSLLTALALASPALAGQPSWLTPGPAELSVTPELGKIQADIDFQQARLATQTARTPSLANGLDRLVAQRRVLEDAVAVQEKKVRLLLPRLWETGVRAKAMLEAGVAPWEHSDRTLAWLGAVFAQANGELGELEAKNRELTANAAEEKQLRAQTDAAFSQMEHTKDALTAGRLKMAEALARLRAESPSPDKRLERVLEVALLSGFSPVNVRERPFAAAQGQLEPPVNSVPAGHAQTQALRFAAARDEPVRAAHWGRVAFAGELHGLGHVVVLAHGDAIFTVYAHLARVAVSPGQEVARSQHLGTAGTLPGGAVPGMSFELRFGVKPSNAAGWFRTGQGSPETFSGATSGAAGRNAVGG